MELKLEKHLLCEINDRIQEKCNWNLNLFTEHFLTDLIEHLLFLDHEDAYIVWEVNL